MKSQTDDALPVGEMGAQLCVSMDKIAQYVECLLADDEADRFDAHLSECLQCRSALAAVVDKGVAPEWLAVCKQTPGSTLGDAKGNSTPFDATLIGTTGEDEYTKVSAEHLTSTSNERYRFEKKLGEGGMGVVWEGWDTVMRRRVALKCLRASGNLKVLAPRLLQEAASLARLSHPNIVAVFEVFNEDKRPTLVMEFVDGPTLSGWRGSKVIGERQAAALMEKLALAVQHAHDKGVVHRDLKPSNILLSVAKDSKSALNDLDTVVPKLSDFGLARIVDEQHLTQTGDMLGTPAYMAPEQTLGDVTAIGPATDVYGLGAILYDLLAGTPPHVAQDPISTLALVRERDPVAPRLLRPELSKDLETICLKCLRKPVGDRYVSAGELASDLRAFLEGRVIKARPLGTVATAVRWCRRHKLLASAITIATMSVVALVVGSFLFARTERSLRTKADEAVVQANQAETLAKAEAKRADEAKAAIQEHFRVVLKVANGFLGLRNTLTLRESVKCAEVTPVLESQSIAIYESYVASLPDPEEWSYQDAIEVLRYTELQCGQPDRIEPWLMKLPPIMDRLEQENASYPNRHDVRLLYSKCMAAMEDGRMNYTQAAKWHVQLGELLQRTIDNDPGDFGIIRMQSHAYMNAAVALQKASQMNDVVSLADRSVASYRKVLVITTEPEVDQINFIEKLVWQAGFHRDAGHREKFVEIEAEALALCEKVAAGSEFRARADRAKADLKDIRNSLFPM